MAVNDGQSVGMTHKQRRNRSVGLRYFQVLRNYIGIVIDVFISLPNQHGAPCASGCSQQ